LAARAAISEGDNLYKERLFGGATDAYRQAQRLLEPLEARVATVMDAAIEDGTTALDSGNQSLALERFDLALAIDSSDMTAQAGQARALQLDKVLALMDEASAYELDEDWPNALKAYQKAQQIDPEWPAAAEGAERVSAIVAGNSYQAAMSAGYVALAAENYSAARSAFARALKDRPGDRDAQTALAQIDSEQRLVRIISLTAAAERLQTAEDWNGAIKEYTTVLAIDSTVVAAREGLEESRSRAELDQRMRDSIADPDRLSDDSVWQPTNTLLEYARGVESPGSVLAAQIVELDRLLQRALVPVTVQLESDNLTDVVIYKIGRLGTFVSRSIELRPGAYTAVGVRNGYHDVRTTFRVVPETAMQPVVLRCEDPI
jgi:tetratricopeptide (TPR) repeat protein